MPDESKVFDVTKPGRTTPDPTSRPVIVGHRPEMPDPMVKEEAPKESASSGTPIHISMDDEEPADVIPSSSSSELDTSSLDAPHTEPDPPESVIHPEEPEQPAQSPTGATIPPNEMEQEPEKVPSEDSGSSNFTPLSSLIPSSDKEDSDQSKSHHVDNLPEKHDGDEQWHEAPPLPISKGAGPKRRWPKILAWLLVATLALLVGAYLAIDAGLIKSDINLPFHIFNKQKTSKSETPPPVKSSQPPSQPPAQSALPAGFSNYKLEGTTISFIYPTAWGTPTITKDAGFSKRGGTNKTDGTYAYVVDFATNKDVQVAITSSKYLPAARGAMYYDFLAWCTGTNDGKFYKQTLHFTSSGGVDTPSTVTCDQGPLADATKVDETTILQAKTKDSSGKDIGDVYTKNLSGSNSELKVLRVKDTSMKNSDDIKKLLSNVKVDSSTP